MRLLRHLDLSLTALAALAIGSLSMFDLAGSGLTTGATLAALGALSAAALAARLDLRRLHAMASRTSEQLSGPPSADRLLSPARPGTDADLRAAGEIAIIGVTLSRTLRHHLADLRACLQRGGTVRIAVIDPSGDAVAEAARRSSVPASPEIFEHRLRPTADLLRELTAAAGPGRLEVRLLDFVPAVGLLMIDPDEADGRLWVDIYSHRFAAEEPTLPLHAGRDRVWYAHFRREFEQIWTAGRPGPVPAR